MLPVFAVWYQVTSVQPVSETKSAEELSTAKYWVVATAHLIDLLVCVYSLLSLSVSGFMLLCSFGILQLNWLKVLVLFLGTEKSDLFWWYEWFILMGLVRICFLILIGEKHIIKKCCFISKVTFHTWIYFVSFWNCLRRLVRLI